MVPGIRKGIWFGPVNIAVYIFIRPEKKNFVFIFGSELP